LAVKEILLLGNPRLYEASLPVAKEELDDIKAVVQDLHDTLMDFRKRYGAGRAIAAPQIGVLKRLIYLHIGQPWILINPVLDLQSPKLMTVWDDCISFPDLLVKVNRHAQCRITCRSLDWIEQDRMLAGDLSELLQHEYDHLDGILAISRAVDRRSFALKSQQAWLQR
jgi:peptide deformylase